jgi:hypothetical protein
MKQMKWRGDDARSDRLLDKARRSPTRDSTAGRGSLLIWRDDDKPRLPIQHSSTALPQTTTSFPAQRHTITEEFYAIAFRIQVEPNNYVTKEQAPFNMGRNRAVSNASTRSGEPPVQVGMGA